MACSWVMARYRERHFTAGAKSDTAVAHLLAEIVFEARSGRALLTGSPLRAFDRGE